MCLPLTFGLIFTAPTPFNTVFWQLLTQTYNASLNYANRNGSSLYANTDIAKSYGIATSTAIVVALGIRKTVQKQATKLRGGKLVMLNSVSAVTACALAGFVNAFIMR